MGLSIVRTIVETHNGQIEVDNRNGAKGAVFQSQIAAGLSSRIFGTLRGTAVAVRCWRHGGAGSQHREALSPIMAAVPLPLPPPPRRFPAVQAADTRRDTSRPVYPRIPCIGGQPPPRPFAPGQHHSPENNTGPVLLPFIVAGPA